MKTNTSIDGQGDMPSRRPMMGHHYTMSAMKHRCGDRSWCHDLWLVLEANPTHVLIKNAAPSSKYSFGVSPMVVGIDDFDWTPADEFAAALRARVHP